MFNEEIEDEPVRPLPPFDIHREGRSWAGDEGIDRLRLLGDLKFEMCDGKMFWNEHTRRLVLGMLLENVGIDAVVQLGDPRRWKEAIAALADSAPR